MGDIRTAFSLSSTGSLLWNNDAFFNGGALFCILPSGDLVAVFVQGAQPESCVFIDLTVSLCKHRYIGGLSYLTKESDEFSNFLCGVGKHPERRGRGLAKYSRYYHEISGIRS